MRQKNGINLNNWYLGTTRARRQGIGRMHYGIVNTETITGTPSYQDPVTTQVVFFEINRNRKQAIMMTPSGP